MGFEEPQSAETRNFIFEQNIVVSNGLLFNDFVGNI